MGSWRGSPCSTGRPTPARRWTATWASSSSTGRIRRGGAGTAAARAIFAAYPGRWQVAVARLNAPALPFWRNAVGGAAGLSGLREDDVRTALWNGPVLSFEVSA